MENKTGRVRNFVVSNVDVFTDVFAIALCRNQVSYVQIENEFHCFDKIFRFYSFEEYKKVRDTLNFAFEDEDFIRMVEPISIIASKSDVELSNVFSDDLTSAVSVDDYMVETRDEKVPSYTKRMIRQSSKAVNDKLRNNYNGRRFINQKRRDL